VTVEINTYIRDEAGAFVPCSELIRYGGDLRHVAGYISFVVDGQPLLDEALWDDVDWLWPYVVQALDECLRDGVGERFFPDQPIRFRAERIGGDRVLLRVNGGSVDRAVTAGRVETVAAVADAARTFFAELERLVPGSGTADRTEVERITQWSDVGT
jgi:hypothetical protein